ncbi:MAG: hypothetical protein MSA31_06625 [Bacteroidales bacterium]|nr:hypothetical protein [Bacteroidales bacterium]
MYYRTHDIIVKTTTLLLLCLSLAACEKAFIPDEGNEQEQVGDGSRHDVTVQTRATTADIAFPLHITVTTSDGATVATQDVNNASDKIKVRLQDGDYHISVSNNVDMGSGWSTTPVVRGGADFSVKGKAATVNIILSYAVASVNVTLNGVGAEATNVSLQLSPLSSSLSQDGTYSGSSTVTIPCSKTGTGTWSTGTAYVYPSAADLTNISISISTPDGTETYSVVYADRLAASVPYSFTGTYKGGESGTSEITGDIVQGEWQPEVGGTFSFGPSGNNAFDNIHAIPLVETASLPGVGTLWNGHIVMLQLSEEGSNPVEMLLMSRNEWTGMTSAFYESDPYVAQNIAQQYAEDELTGWHIPTTDEARSIKDKWGGDALTAINTTLSGASLTPLTATDTNGNVRYLCNEAQTTFSFAPSSSITAAGKTVKTYRLRVVKRIRFKLKNS